MARQFIALPCARALGLFFLSVLFVAQATAGTVVGSAVVTRSYIDSAGGQIFVYGGGHFDAGLKISTVTWDAN